MIVEYQPLQDEVLDVCRRFVSESEEDTFSARQLSDVTGFRVSQVVEKLGWLLENCWIERLSDAWSEVYLPDELWCLHQDHLTPGKEYEVLGIEADFFRILTDENHAYCPNDPVLFSPSGFIMRDPIEPAFWVSEVGTDGVRYAYPPEWMSVGFFEDYHNGVKSVINQFWDGIRKYYHYTWLERKSGRLCNL